MLLKGIGQQSENDELSHDLYLTSVQVFQISLLQLLQII
jgi:hypothetical protein